jgi:hypothetical protein
MKRKKWPCACVSRQRPRHTATARTRPFEDYRSLREHHRGSRNDRSLRISEWQQDAQRSPDFSPAQPWRAETRFFPSKAAASDKRCSFQARSFSLQGWGLIDLPLRASNEGLLRPRVARAQKIIRPHPSPATLRQYHFSKIARSRLPRPVQSGEA